jgi:hypothetical protein
MLHWMSYDVACFGAVRRGREDGRTRTTRPPRSGSCRGGVTEHASDARGR